MNASTTVGRGRLRARLALLSLTTSLRSGLAAPASPSRRWATLVSAACLGGVAIPAVAQEAPPTIAPLKVEQDRNGVNITTGKTVIDMPTISIPAAPRLAFSRVQDFSPYIVGETKSDPSFTNPFGRLPGSSGGNYSFENGSNDDGSSGDGDSSAGDDDSPTDTWSSADGYDVDDPITKAPTSSFSVHYGGESGEAFQCSDNDCHSILGTGSSYTPGANEYLQAGTGVIWLFDQQHVNAGFNGGRSELYYASTATYPDGEVISYSYDTATYAGDQFNRLWYRPKRVSTNLGYYLTITYQTNTFTAPGWAVPAQVTMYNSADPGAPLGQLTYAADGSIQDLKGRVFHCTGCSNAVGAYLESSAGTVQLPGEATAMKVVTNVSDTNVVATVQTDGVTWNYNYQSLAPNAYSGGYSYKSLAVTGPDGFSERFGIGGTNDLNLITSVTDELGRVTSYSYDHATRPILVTRPEGDAVALQYDDNGNVISKTMKAKPGSGLADLVETATYDPNCADSVLCFRPSSHTDARGNETDYVYNEQGLLTEQTDPADANGVRRKTYITYDAHDTGAGVIYRRSVVRVCGDTTTCGTASEIRTEYDYWGNTFLPSAERQIDGTTDEVRTTTYSYDAAGRVLSVDKPRPGTDDATYFRYDVLGRKTWDIAGAGPNGVRVANVTSYRDADDKVSSVQTGAIPDQNSTAFALFTRVDTSYDAHRNPARVTTSDSSATPYLVTDHAYDDRGLLTCETTRMNQAAFGSLPVDACQLGTEGTQGPDRITRNVYDVAGQLLQVRRAVGTSLEQGYATYAYTPDGKRSDVIDANGNRAHLAYDGFDRQSQWQFPSATTVSGYDASTPDQALATAGAIDTADYEQYGYDANGNRTSLRKRDGTTLTYGYDALNRMASKTVPASTSGAPGYAVGYSYDVRGLQTSARFNSGRARASPTATTRLVS